MELEAANKSDMRVHGTTLRSNVMGQIKTNNVHSRTISHLCMDY